MPQLTMAKALNDGLRRAMDADPKVVLMGEDIGKLGGVFRITEGLQKDFGEQRVIDAPLAESGIIGTGVGLSVRGYRPVCEIQFDAFVFPAYDQIVTQVAKLHFRTNGTERIPMVIRIPFGGGIGSPEHHSESPETLFAHHAGLRVMAPSTPHDAYWMIQEAIADDDPVVFFEPKRRYWLKGEVDTENPDPAEGRARVITQGTDVTVLTYGPVTTTGREVVTTAAEEGISVELIDLRSISPLDMDTINASVRRTGRLVVVHEAPTFLGLGAEIAARVTEECFYSLEAPVVRVGGFHTPYPPSRLEEHYLPDVDRIMDGIDRAMAH